MRLFIEPNDVLMFRDGKPFSGGDDHFARGSFPPPPSTIYGAIRSHILSLKSGEFNTFKTEPEKISKDIRDEIGTPNELGSMTIKQFTLAKKNSGTVQQYFHIPRDLVKEKVDKDLTMYILKPYDKLHNSVITDLPSGLKYLWYPTENALENASGFISATEMAKYLLGDVPSTLNTEEIVKTEERTGIGKSRITRSVETGRLYSVEYFRMNHDFGFAIEISGTNLLPDSGILRLGGDNRSARYSKISWDDIPTEEVKEKIKENRLFKLILITPAIFSKGWIPEGLDENSMEGRINGVKVKLISACIGKPISIGGFDIAKGMPKIMHKAVPAGSIYYFELFDDIEALFNKLWLKSISDFRAKEGFGITLIGGFKLCLKVQI